MYPEIFNLLVCALLCIARRSKFMSLMCLCCAADNILFVLMIFDNYQSYAELQKTFCHNNSFTVVCNSHCSMTVNVFVYRKVIKCS